MTRLLFKKTIIIFISSRNRAWITFSCKQWVLTLFSFCLSDGWQIIFHSYCYCLLVVLSITAYTYWTFTFVLLKDYLSFCFAYFSIGLSAFFLSTSKCFYVIEIESLSYERWIFSHLFLSFDIGMSVLLLEYFKFMKSNRSFFFIASMFLVLVQKLSTVQSY